jgi:sigma-B regulation protein RsbU (phosphoserine phosphatase)
MSALIDNVLDFARGRLGGGLDLTLAEQPLTPVLQQIVAELQATARDRKIEAVFDLPRPIDCDRGKIGQLFSNLLANALTHSPPDSPVHVHGGIRDGFFELSVANAGEPIPPATLERLFQPFFRGAVRDSRQGLGLGLYIASEIARAHKGMLTVQSDSRETRFTFRMPLGAAA